MDKLKELRAERDALHGKALELLSGEATDEQLAEAEGLTEKAKALDKQIRLLEASLAADEERKKEAAAETARVAAEESRTAALAGAGAVAGPGGGELESGGGVVSRGVLPANVKRWGRLENFSGPDADLRAYRCGMWCLGAAGQQRAADWCKEQGLELRLHQENVNTLGGYLVPDEFDNDLIDLRERYGVFRKFARMVPMASDTKSRRRKTGGLTAYFVGEGEDGTESTAAGDLVQLVAKKLMVLSTYTNELNEDAVLNIGDDLAGEIGLAFATKEDACGFNGDGTSAYGGIVGVRSAIEAVSGTAACIEAGASGTAASWAGVILADFHSMIGKLPEYAETPGVGWFCSKLFFANVMQKLMYAAGGNTVENIANETKRTFMGYPVNVCQAMPKTATAAEIVCLFGDLRLAADFGDRRQSTIAFSFDATVDSVNVFETDEVAIRGTERFDINVHSVGSSSVAGPVTALLTAS